MCGIPGSVSPRNCFLASSICSRRLSEAWTVRKADLGIGLALVKALVEIHDGSVHARSAGVGQGSEFLVRLPLRGMFSNGSNRGHNGAGIKVRHRLHLLVVDDNMDAADSLAILLRLAHHDVRVAYSGPSAIEAALLHKPSIVLLDLGFARAERISGRKTAAGRTGPAESRHHRHDRLWT